MLDQPAKLRPARFSRHVDDGSGDRRARDSISDFDLVGEWQAYAVPVDPVDLAPRPVRRDDVYHRQSLLPQAKQLGCAPMREDGSPLTGVYGSEHAPPPVDRTVTDGRTHHGRSAGGTQTPRGR